ncbi:MAG: MATE family efflux transporter [Oscillibacter sp.]|nr:MATE family efflux transporter [Oscillibacter sp.]
MGNKQTELMGNAPVSTAILKLSIPVVCGMMVQVLYNLVDTFFIGRLHDQNQLTAASITTPVFMILMAISTIVSTGAASYISRCIGRKDSERANRTLTTGVMICTALAVVAMSAGLLLIKPFVMALGASAEVYPFARQYVMVMLLGAIPVMLSFTGGQMLRAEGAAMPSIIGMMIGTVANVIFDPIFIFGLHLGILGAGIATVLGNVAALGYYIWYYLSGKSILRIKPSYLTRDKAIWKEIFFIGIPACLSQLLSSAALMTLNNQAKAYGDTVLAGMGVSSKLAFIGTFIFMGFAAGCQPLIGYNYGAQNYKRVREIFKTGMMMTCCIGIVLTVVFWLFADGLVAFFTPLPEVVIQGARVFRISIFAFVILGPQMLATTGIQAFGKAKESLILSVARQGFVYIPLLFLLQSWMGFTGLIWAQPIADAITLCLGLAFLKVILKKCTREDSSDHTDAEDTARESD